MDATIETSAKPPDDPLSEFGRELDALIRRWSERTGGQCDIAVRPTFIDEPPEQGWRRQRKGPLVEIALAVLDTSRADELAISHFPVSLRHPASREESRG